MAATFSELGRVEAIRQLFEGSGYRAAVFQVRQRLLRVRIAPPS